MSCAVKPYCDFHRNETDVAYTALNKTTGFPRVLKINGENCTERFHSSLTEKQACALKNLSAF